jgi:putative DNA-invertase from lambdoid prophage Rac
MQGPQLPIWSAPSFTDQQLATVLDMLAAGHGVSAVAKAAKLSRQAVYRLKDDPAWAEGLLAKWTAKRRDAA